MTATILSLIFSSIALVLAILSLVHTNKQRAAHSISAYNSVPLQLQAYERLVLLTERISIPNLISRLNQPQLTSKEMQLILIENIKNEFEYNASQQIYVSNIAWEAVRNLKDQNMLIINQVANILPADAKGGELSKQLVEIIMNQKEAALHSIVLNALNFEAKKLLK